MDKTAEYILSLKPGERVIETSRSCMWAATGTVYVSQNELTRGSICVMWDGPNGMGTAATGGTRRFSDVPADELNTLLAKNKKV